MLPALQAFHRVYGHTDVPQEFVVPIGGEIWPKSTWGLRLGATVGDIRHQKVYSIQVAISKEELDQMNLCYGMTISDRDWEEKLLPSFREYSEQFGDCIIPRSFVVSPTPQWPEKAWGMPLGVLISDMRLGKTYVEQAARDKDALGAIGFAYIIVPALEVYVNVHKKRAISSNFVVPSENPWSRQAWGKKVGRIFFDVCYQGTYLPYFGRDIEKLWELGLDIRLRARAWKRVVPLLDMYAALHGEGEIPYDFVIPSEDPWEEKMWSIRLGLLVVLNSQFSLRK